MSHALALTLILAAGQTGARKVDGLLVASLDRTLIERIEKQYVPGDSLDALRKTLQDERFSIVEWGTRSAILIDLELPYLQVRTDETALLRAFAKHVKSDLTVNLADLDEPERAGIQRTLGRILVGPSAEALKGATMGIAFASVYTVRGGNGKAYTTQRRVTDERSKVRDTNLRKNPTSMGSSEISKAEMQQKLRDVEAKQKATESISFRSFGIATRNLPEGIAEAGKAIQKVLREVLFARQEASLALAKKMGISQNKLAGDQPISGLPAKVANDAKDTFMEHWSVNGFKSPSEAEDYYDSVTAVQVGTALSMAFCTSAGNSQHAPTFFSFEIGSFYGALP